MLLDGWHLLSEAAAARLAVEKIAICGPPTAREQTVDRSAAARGRARSSSVGHGAERALARERADRRRRAARAGRRSRSTPFSSPRPRSCWPRPGCRIPAMPARSSGPRPPPARPASSSTSRRPIRGAGRRCARRWAARFTCRCCAAAGSPRSLDGLARGGRPHRRHGAARRHVDVRRGLHEADRAAPRRRRRRACPTIAGGVADARVTIPMHGAVESLNVAVAAAVLLYEAQRQRTLVTCKAASPRPRR